MSSSSRAKDQPCGQVEPMGERQVLLNWAADCNWRGIGFLGPSVRRFGPIPEYEPYVAEGVVRVVQSGESRNTKALGYWITDAGRAALNPTSGEGC
jgi:hypothetical protein